MPELVPEPFAQDS